MARFAARKLLLPRLKCQARAVTSKNHGGPGLDAPQVRPEGPSERKSGQYYQKLKDTIGQRRNAPHSTQGLRIFSPRRKAGCLQA